MSQLSDQLKYLAVGGIAGYVVAKALVTNKPSKPAAPSKLKLLYGEKNFWRAEAPRLALFIGGVQFDDWRPTREERAELKAKGILPFGQVPVLFVGDKPVAQTGGICRFAGKLSGLYPEDLFAAAKVDEVIDFTTDMTNKVGATFKIADSTEKVAARDELYKATLPAMFTMLENLLRANGSTGYFVGDSLTVADLCVWRCLGWFTSGILDGIGTDVAAKHSALNVNIANVNAHPKVKEWKAKYPQFYKD